MSKDKTTTTVQLKTIETAVLYSSKDAIRKSIVIRPGTYYATNIHTNDDKEIWLDIEIAGNVYPVIVETSYGRTPIGKALKIVDIDVDESKFEAVWNLLDKEEAEEEKKVVLVEEKKSFNLFYECAKCKVKRGAGFTEKVMMRKTAMKGKSEEWNYFCENCN